MSEALTKVVIDLAALRHNLRSIQERLGQGVRIMAVVKSDAYGHGLERCAEVLAQEGTDFFAVSEVEEGVRLRRAGIKGEIVILFGARPADFEALFEYDLAPVFFSREGLLALDTMATRIRRQLRGHLKIDMGMGRLGIMPGEVEEFVDLLGSMQGLVLAGVMSHFPLADSPDPTPTTEQCRRFQEIVNRFPLLVKPGVLQHIANSAATMLFPESHLDMVRPGISLYGCYPEPGMAEADETGLRPVMGFSTQVLQVKEVPAGHGLSYGHIHVTRRPTRLAVLPVGYDDGYLRGLSGKAEVLIGGRRVPVLGRICMKACVADISDLPEVRPGDEVVLFGRQGDAEISVDEVAGWLDTISYEVLCLVGAKNKRFYVDERGH